MHTNFMGYFLQFQAVDCGAKGSKHFNKICLRYGDRGPVLTDSVLRTDSRCPLSVSCTNAEA